MHSSSQSECKRALHKLEKITFLVEARNRMRHSKNIESTFNKLKCRFYGKLLCNCRIRLWNWNRISINSNNADSVAKDLSPTKKGKKWNKHTNCKSRKKHKSRLSFQKWAHPQHYILIYSANTFISFGNSFFLCPLSLLPSLFFFLLVLRTSPLKAHFFIHIQLQSFVFSSSCPANLCVFGCVAIITKV